MTLLVPMECASRIVAQPFCQTRCRIQTVSPRFSSASLQRIWVAGLGDAFLRSDSDVQAWFGERKVSQALLFGNPPVTQAGSVSPAWNTGTSFYDEDVEHDSDDESVYSDPSNPKWTYAECRDARKRLVIRARSYLPDDPEVEEVEKLVWSEPCVLQGSCGASQAPKLKKTITKPKKKAAKKKTITKPKTKAANKTKTNTKPKKKVVKKTKAKTNTKPKKKAVTKTKTAAKKATTKKKR